MLIVHAGNRIDAPGRETPRFPAHAITGVRRRVLQLLSAVRPRLVVSAAASGADLIVLSCAQELHIPVAVYVPLPIEDFVRQSVVGSGDDWVKLFRDVIALARCGADASSVVVANLADHHEWWFEANNRLIALAQELGGDGEPLVALTIRPRSNGKKQSVTDHLADLAERVGAIVLTLDPLASDVLVG